VLPSNGRVLATGWLPILEGLLHILKVSLLKTDSCQLAIPLKEDEKTELEMTYLRTAAAGIGTGYLRTVIQWQLSAKITVFSGP
jgi:hypothetical protein